MVNVQDFDRGNGTHWVCYSPLDGRSCYSDSYGDLFPPRALLDYLPGDASYNFERVQEYGQVHCRQLCLLVLSHLSAGFEFEGFVDMLK